MVEEQALTYEEYLEQLRHLCKTDADPRVRRRAHGVLLVARPSAGRGGALLWDRPPSGARLAGPLPS